MIVTSVPKRGYDTWVDNDHQHREHGSDDWLHLESADSRVLLWLPIPALVAGRAIASAIVTGHAHGVMAAQTITFTPLASQWEAKTANWANQPATRAGTVSVTIPVLQDGDEFSVDLATLVQQVADGQKHFGWRVTTNAATVQKLASFQAGVDAWTFSIEFPEEPDAPTVLVPDDSDVAVPLPVGTFDFTDYGGESTDLAEVRIQIDVGGDGTINYDSSWVPATSPSFDLSVSALTVTSGQTVKWRVAVGDGDGQQSDFSDWATYTYRPAGVLTLLSPAGGSMYDPTSEILASFTGQNLSAYRIWITDGDDSSSIRYDSRKRAATDPHAIAHELPLKNDDGSRIFTDDHDYRILVRAFDDRDRQATPGVPAHVDVTATVHFDDDDALAKVTSFQVRQIDDTPFVQLTWTDVAAADAYLVAMDGVHIGRLEPADVVAGVSSYSWVYEGAAPWVDHVFELRRLTTGVGRSEPRRQPVIVKPRGVWLLRANGESVVLDGRPDQLDTPEQRETYEMLNLPYDVDVVTGYRGLTGPLDLSIEQKSDQTVAAAKDVLDGIKRHPNEPVRIIFAGVSKPVLVKRLTVLPASDFLPNTQRHSVRFTVSQVGEFDYRLG